MCDGGTTSRVISAVLEGRCASQDDEEGALKKERSPETSFHVGSTLLRRRLWQRLLVAIYGSTSTADCSWLVLQLGKACYNPLYHG
jgi:hypothetical protein